MRGGSCRGLKADLAKVLARKAEGDSKAIYKLASDSEIDDEAVGFHAQQAIEKWLKAVMAPHGLKEARIHDLGRLLEILSVAGVDSPPNAHRNGHADRSPAHGCLGQTS
jgi:HEPN domain-containing protein